MRLALSILTFVCILLMAKPLKADNGVWKYHSIFNENRTQLVDTKDKVYFVTDNNLNAFNKKTEEFENLTINDRLSSYYVNKIYYNAKKDYIVVTYKDYNIDVLLNNGNTINIADIKNITIVADKTINDVNFGNDGFYVASNIGYLYVEDKGFTVKKSALFNEKINSIAEVGDNVFIAANSNVFFSKKENNIKSLAQMTSSSLNITGKILPINDTQYFLNSNLLYLVSIDDNNNMTKKSVSSAFSITRSRPAFRASDNPPFGL